MIEKISQTESDLKTLSTQPAKTGILPEPAMDYKNVVVNKPWGYEYLLYQNQYLAIWMLFIKPGAATSMHCHPNKKTSLVVLDGEVLTSSLGGQFSLKTKDALMIDQGVFHSTKAISSGQALIMEIETPNLKSDLVRLADQYGRENKPYENKTHFSNLLGDYEYYDFHAVDPLQKTMTEVVIKGRTLRLYANYSLVQLFESTADVSQGLVCFLDKNLLVAGAVGDILTLESLKQLDSSRFDLTAITALVIN